MIKFLFTYCDCTRKRPKREAPSPQCSFSPHGMVAGEDQMSTVWKEGITSLLRIPNRSSCLLMDSGDRGKGQGKELGVEKYRVRVEISASAYLRLLNVYLYVSTLIDITSIIRLLFFRGEVGDISNA